MSLLIEQVDQIDGSNHAALKGIRAEPQQPELPRLREALAAADKVVLLAEGADVVPRLGGSLPVFIEATEGPEWEETAEALDDVFLGDAEIWCVWLGDCGLFDVCGEGGGSFHVSLSSHES